MIASAPEKLFVNLYEKGVGGNRGSVYETREEADRCASPSRQMCLELSAGGNGFELSVASRAVLAERARHLGVSPGQVLADALNIFLSIPDEVRVQAQRYASEHKIAYHTAIAEAARAFFVEAA